MAKRKPHGHYCKVCGEYKANEKFSGKGHAAHICKACAKLSPAERSEQMTLNRLLDLPWYLSKDQIKWLNNRIHDERPEVRELAKEQYDIRFNQDKLPDTEIDEFDEWDEYSLDEFDPDAFDEDYIDDLPF